MRIGLGRIWGELGVMVEGWEGDGVLRWAF